MNKPEWIDQEMFDMDKRERMIEGFIEKGEMTPEEKKILTSIRIHYLSALAELGKLWRLQK